MEDYKVSIFRGFSEIVGELTVDEIVQHIKYGKYSEEINKLREVLEHENELLYKQQKKNLLAFTVSGIFKNGRKVEYLKNYNSLIILDIDNIQKDIESLKEKIIAIPCTYCCFLSPSSRGLKIIVRVSSDKGLHLSAFNQLKSFYEHQISAIIDPSGKDITRLCFYSYDPQIYFNPESNIFEVTVPQALSKDIIDSKVILVDKIERLIKVIVENRVDITSDYYNWCKIGFAIESEFKESGRMYYHSISRFYPRYSFVKCNEQYDKCLKSNNSGIRISTLFQIAKESGIYYSESGFQILKGNRSNMSQSVSHDYSNSIQNTTNKIFQAKNYLMENYEIRKNIISQEFEYRKKEQFFFKTLNEYSIYIQMQLDNVNISFNNLNAILRSDIVQEYNPFLDYFENLPPWNKSTDFINNLANYVVVKEKDRERFNVHFKKWLVRVVKCSILDDYFNKQAFILVQNKQNSGKSTFCRFICPPLLSNYIAENLTIDKDSRILLTTNLLINLDELSTLSKLEINSLKSMFSKDKINERLPYDRKNSIIPRRASFIGSTNQSEFLTDETGSVRWLCFEIEDIIWSYKKEINIDLVYSQAYYLFKDGFKAELNSIEIAENDEINSGFQVLTSERELIFKYFEPSDKQNGQSKFMTATDIMVYIQHKTKDAVTLYPNNIGKALKQLNFIKCKGGPDAISGYWIIERIKNKK